MNKRLDFMKIKKFYESQLRRKFIALARYITITISITMYYY